MIMISAVVNLPGASTSAKRKYITVTIPSLDQYKDYKVRSAFMIDSSQFFLLFKRMILIEI